MVTITVKHTVANYDTWLETYQKYSTERREHGGAEGLLLPPLEAGGPVMIVEEWTSPGAFEAFKEAIDLPTVMKAAGVTSPPEINVYATRVDA